MSVRLSAWNNAVPTRRFIMTFDISVFFRKSVAEIKVSLRYDKDKGTLH